MDQNGRMGSTNGHVGENANYNIEGSAQKSLSPVEEKPDYLESTSKKKKVTKELKKMEMNGGTRSE